LLSITYHDTDLFWTEVIHSTLLDKKLCCGQSVGNKLKTCFN